VELKIRNVGKIDSADIEIKGITIIAGLNGTGKSTVSRSLFAMFHSFSNISRKINWEKQYAIEKLFFSSNYFLEIYFINERDKSIEEISAILAGKTDKKNVYDILVRYFNNHELVEEVIDEIIKINSATNESLQNEIVSEIFLDEFNGYITNIRSHKDSRIELKIRDFEIKVLFDYNNELLEVKEKKELAHEIVYIDDPFIIDSHNFSKKDVEWSFLSRTGKKITNHRMSLLSHYANTKNLTLIDRANLKDKLKVIYKKINDTLGSDMSLFETDKDGISGSKRTRGLSLDSLSSGMKTFYLIKSLIDNGTIVQNGTLILDEPEVHLHPDWQVTLAEVIVLLQREMGLHILINTHSPYFLRAIEVFSGKYDTEDVVKYYLSYNEGDNARMKDVTFNISEIYKVLSGPLQRIENEGYNDRD
jgi:ABC transporter, ATP-binding protein